MSTRILLFFAAFFATFTFSQQFENGSFDDWENVGTPTAEPLNWSSLKTADALAGTAPTVIARETGRTGTGYCVMLETKSVFGISANGILTNGRIHADLNPNNGYVFTNTSDSQWNTPFTFRPDSLIGWYKYAPANNDKGKIEVALHTGTNEKLPGMTPSNIVGAARFDAVSPTSNWTRFSVPFQYLSSNDPAYLLAVLTSGDSTLSQNGSKIWFDDIALIYNSNTASISTESLTDLSFYFTENSLKCTGNFPQESTVFIYDLSGKCILTQAVEETIEFPYPTGIYMLHVESNSGRIIRKMVK